MTARGMTRRSLLAATAGAMAGGLTRPRGVLAALVWPGEPELVSPPEPALAEQWVGDLSPKGRTIELAHSADLLGVEWQAPANVRVELCFRGYDGRWSGWVSAGRHGHGPDLETPPSGRLMGDPVWTGGTTAVRLRASRALSGVRLHLVDVSGGRGAHREALFMGPLATAAALPRATPMLPAGAGQPPIIARRAWAQGMARPRVAPGYGAVRMAFVHHTENPNGYAPGEVPAMLRAIFAFHRYVRGWNDIGYNFVVDSFGRVFEGRAGGIDEPVVGAHAGGYNLVSTGVAVLGAFASQPISAAARDALERLLAWKLSLHGRPSTDAVTVRVNPAGAIYSRFPANARVSLPRIAGHRDGDSTDCPGDALYGELPGIRPGVQRLAGRPARATLALAAAPSGPPAPAPPGGEPPSEARTLTGSLTFLDGAGGVPIQGAPIAIQARSVSRRGEVVRERTIAQATTGPKGEWSLPLYSPSPGGSQIAAGTWLRALCPGAAGVPAVVSDPLHVTGAVSLMPVPAPAPAPTQQAATPPAM